MYLRVGFGHTCGSLRGIPCGLPRGGGTPGTYTSHIHDRWHVVPRQHARVVLYVLSNIISNGEIQDRIWTYRWQPTWHPPVAFHVAVVHRVHPCFHTTPFSEQADVHIANAEKVSVSVRVTGLIKQKRGV